MEYLLVNVRNDDGIIPGLDVLINGEVSRKTGQVMMLSKGSGLEIVVEFGSETYQDTISLTDTTYGNPRKINFGKPAEDKTLGKGSISLTKYGVKSRIDLKIERASNAMEILVIPQDDILIAEYNGRIDALKELRNELFGEELV